MTSAILPRAVAQLSRTATLSAFKAEHFQPQTPCVVPAGSALVGELPATKRWFQRQRQLDLGYLGMKVVNETVSLELTGEKGDGTRSFERLNAVPLSYFLSYLAAPPAPSTQQLYLAQEGIPASLADDLPTPELVRRAGKGDVYASTLWAGLPGSGTPIHRDPNSNLYVHLLGTKRWRLFSPQSSFARTLPQAGLRDEKEMMASSSAVALNERVWSCTGDEAEEAMDATLEAGDAIFVPMGWWHAVRSEGIGAGMGVNWWFR